MVEIIKKLSLRKIAIVGIAAALLGAFILPVAPAHVEAQSDAEVRRGLGGAPGGGGGAEGTVRNVIQAFLNLFSILIGIAGVLFMMVGGFKYITAGGDPGKVSSAQNTILYAAAGLVVAALAQVFVRFVLGRVQV